MKTLLVPLAVIWPVAIYAPVVLSQTKTIDLKIRVVKQAWGDKQPRPFSGVGVFDLIRGNTKLEGAACPDRSGVTGELACKIPCKPDADDVMTLRVRPPSDQDALAGWVTPPPQDVQVQRCSVAPALITMQYQDARFALNELLSKKYFATASGGGGAGGTTQTPLAEPWLELLKGSNVGLTKFASGKATTSTGRADLAKLYRVASEGTKLPGSLAADESPADHEQAAALAKWQLLSKSALLEAQVNKTLPAAQRGQIQLSATADLMKYRADLSAADRLLSNLPNKSPEQLRLSDDIKTLKALPATGTGAAPAAAIIEKWM